MRKGLSEQSAWRGERGQSRGSSHRSRIDENVIRLYYGACWPASFISSGRTPGSHGTTLRMTESLYKDGSGTVNKTDYLDNKVMVETVRSLVAPLEANQASPRRLWPTPSACPGSRGHAQDETVPSSRMRGTWMSWSPQPMNSIPIGGDRSRLKALEGNAPPRPAASSQGGAQGRVAQALEQLRWRSLNLE